MLDLEFFIKTNIIILFKEKDPFHHEQRKNQVRVSSSLLIICPFWAIYSICIIASCMLTCFLGEFISKVAIKI